VAVNGWVCPISRLAVAGLTVTDATAAGVTVIAAVPVLPSDAAVIVADPGDNAVTKPADDTVAIPGALLLQVTVRPLSTSPSSALRVADSAWVCPTPIEVVAGATVTVATGSATTVTVAVADLPSEAAVMTADPVATAVTSPALVTVATPGVPLVQVTTRPIRADPDASLGMAVKEWVCPITKLALGGVTSTEATGAPDTVTAAVAVFPSIAAVITAEPMAFAVTTPADVTEATDGLLLVQVAGPLFRTLPEASRGVALNVVVPPTIRLADEGETETEATATGETVTFEESAAPSIWATMLALPGVTAVTTPVDETLAMEGRVEVHDGVRPRTGSPSESCAVALRVRVVPTTRLATAGNTATVATSDPVTVTVQVADLPSTV
jgi:hypothetical protein